MMVYKNEPRANEPLFQRFLFAERETHLPRKYCSIILLHLHGYIVYNPYPGAESSFPRGERTRMLSFNVKLFFLDNRFNPGIDCTLFVRPPGVMEISTLY
jgi:hypothetical protein